MILEGWLQMLSDDKCTHWKQKDHRSPGACCPACQRVRAQDHSRSPGKKTFALRGPRPGGKMLQLKLAPRAGRFSSSHHSSWCITPMSKQESCWWPTHCCLWLRNWALRQQYLLSRHLQLQLPGLCVEGPQPAPACMRMSPAVATCC